MDFLSALINLFSGENNSNPIFDIIGKLTSGNLNFLEVLSSDAFKNLFSTQKENKNPTESVGNFSGLSPVTNFADREIICALNSYLGG